MARRINVAGDSGSGKTTVSRAIAARLGLKHVELDALFHGPNWSSAPKEELQAAIKRIPAGYIGTVEETAAVVRFLVSDEARYINGANIQISGAWGV